MPPATTNSRLTGQSALPTEDRYSTAAATPIAATAPAPISPYDTTTQTPAAMPATPQSSAVQLTSAPGQYRPGGTSSYSAPSTSHVEVATRPAPPTPTTAPAQPSAAGATSAPWSPPASSTTPSGRMY
jgi:hypothetical protein